MIESVRNEINSEGENLNFTEITPTKRNKSSSNILQSLFSEEDSNSDLTSSADEIERYIHTQFNDIPRDLNDFWGRNTESFPKLAHLAKKVLSIPASSSANERSFSKLRTHLTEYRESLSAETINALFIAASAHTKIEF